MNNINLVGRLTNDPTFKVTSNALNITTFRLAVKNSRNSSVLFINVVCFDKLANNTFKYLQKATMVAVSGRLDMFEKENKETYYSVTADDVQFLTGTKVVEEAVKDTVNEG